MKARPHFPISIVIIYGVAILIGKSLMKGRQPFKWRKGLVRNNFILESGSTVRQILQQNSLYNFSI